jgi:hypothetical protein
MSEQPKKLTPQEELAIINRKIVKNRIAQGILSVFNLGMGIWNWHLGNHVIATISFVIAIGCPLSSLGVYLWYKHEDTVRSARHQGWMEGFDACGDAFMQAQSEIAKTNKVIATGMQQRPGAA